jgi:hypothetical protein
MSKSPKSSEPEKKQIVLRTGGTAVKITFEIGDAAAEPAATAKDAKNAVSTDTKPPTAESKPATEPKTAEPKPEPKAVESKPVVEVPKPASESSPAVAARNNPLHSFDRQGGVNDIADPGRGNPNVYQFVMPKGEA